jgi:DNA helicase-2/ATP-dependent DNA helicase PcrA
LNKTHITKSGILVQSLSELNGPQLQAVTHIDSSMLVIAGAGSGKTKVLTTRIAWLVKNKLVTPGEILAVTFTNKAAKEMSGRIANLLEIDTRGLWIGTFHSVSLKILAKHHQLAGLPAYFQILDANDQLALLKRLIKAANLDENNYSPKELQKFINNHKENGQRAINIDAQNFREQHWLELYRSYEEVCNRDGLVDFTELLLRSYEMLMLNENILKHYQTGFKHILVDEFQDTNQLQYRWLKLLASPNTQMFAVGDDDQSIYSFRGAKVSNMQLFLKDYSVKAPICLEQNYRSTPNILLAANAVISNNNLRTRKNLWTENPSGELIRWYEGYTEEDEAYFVLDEIKALERSGVHLSDIAILYRSNAQSRVFEQLFYSNGIAYRVYGGLRFFDRQEIKHILSYLRLILNPNDNEAFLRVVNFPTRGIGMRSIENLQNIATENNQSLYQAANLLEGKPRQSIGKFITLINQLREQINGMTIAETINHVIINSGIAEHYNEDKKGGIERLENLNELVNSVSGHKTEENLSTLADFLSYAVLESGERQSQNQDNAVQLMTVHAAKGLEFKVVFVVGLEDGLFPHENSLHTEQHLEEERRLIYVAITRAKEQLYLLRACSRLMWGKRQTAPISRFVDEIPSELIRNISCISKIGQSEIKQVDLESCYSSVVNPETKTSRAYLANQDMSVKIGDMVKHIKFGNGKVMRLNTDGKKIIAEIFFIGLGKKTLDLNIAKLEHV